MATLHLNLHGKWFDMILIGIKKEEYRAMSDFWNKRLLDGKKYNTITFSNGYSRSRRQFVIEYLGLQTGLGNPQWGAPENEEVFRLMLGNIISRNEFCV